MDMRTGTTPPGTDVLVKGNEGTRGTRKKLAKFGY